MDPQDFYEEDEPIEDILDAWDKGDKCITAAPQTLIDPMEFESFDYEDS